MAEFVRPVRRTYIHEKCGSSTTITQPEAEAFARRPQFYSDVFCSWCVAHFPPSEFVWKGADDKVGS